MPPPAHAKVIFSGTLGPQQAPTEEWSNTISIGNEGNVSGSNDNPALVALASSLAAAWTTHIKPRCHAQVTLRRVRVARIGDGGLVFRTGAGAYAQGDHNIAAGTSSSVAPNVPFQTALVYGLRSEWAGPTGRGRFFLPLPQFALEPGGTLSAGSATEHLTALKAFINAVNAITSDSLGVVVVASGGSATQGISPALRTVTRVEVGKAPDMMSSRRRSLEEGYVSSTLAA